MAFLVADVGTQLMFIDGFIIYCIKEVEEVQLFLWAGLKGRLQTPARSSA